MARKHRKVTPKSKLTHRSWYSQYVYGLDPINQSDYSGQGLFGFLTAAVAIVKYAVTNYSSNKYVAAATKIAAPVVNAVKSIVAAAPAAQVSAKTAPPAVKQVSSIYPKDRLDFGKLKPQNRIGADPSAPVSYQTTQVSASFCFALCGDIGLSSDGSGIHLTVGYSLGQRYGISAGVGGGPGKVDTGGHANISCSAGLLGGQFSSDGLNSNSFSAMFNFWPTQAGCSSGPSVTF